MTTMATTLPRQRPTPSTGPIVSNIRLAMVALVVGELMLFVGLVGMYLVFRLQAVEWPPPGQPRLPLALTSVNTLVLLASALTLLSARRALQRADIATARRQVVRTLVLGGTFLAVQGVEWTRLVHHGLTLGSTAYGGAFYLLIGCHALHVLGGSVLLGLLARWTGTGRVSEATDARFEACAIYWAFVVSLWLVLFPLVYLY